MPVLELTFDSGESSLSVSRFSIHEGISCLFVVSVWALSDDPSLDLDAFVGQPASLRVESGFTFTPLGGARRWSGICNAMQLVKAEQAGKSTYQLTIVPTLWVLTQRRGHRVYQHLSIPEIADQLLSEWSLQRTWNLDRAAYPRLEHKVQYNESDHDFLGRLLSEAGIAFTFPDDAASASLLTFDDRLETRAPRATPPLPFERKGGKSAEVITALRLGHDVRPGAHTVRDFDPRNVAFTLLGQARKAAPPEDRYEQFEYSPGAFHVESPEIVGTPLADDEGMYRRDQGHGDARAQRALDAERARKVSISFATSTVDLWPGVVFTIDNHPHAELPAGQRLLVTEFFLEGTPASAWQMAGSAVLASLPYRPPSSAPKPRVHSVQSAIVVGPAGQAIHTDEHGRVRVRFPWDREGTSHESSSPWVRVSEGWAGTGFGALTLPRVGQEVLIGFLGGDPDHPIVVGRLFNMTNPVPHRLPENKTRSGWQSDSSPGSGGSNEILFEDLAGNELVHAQAQKNQRRLVKHDETITVGHDREKFVTVNETDTTIGNRTELTAGDRVEEVYGSRTTAARQILAKHVEGDEIERTLGSQTGWIGQDRHLIVERTKRDLVEGDSHLQVGGSRSESVGSQALSTTEQQEKVGGNHAVTAGLSLHAKAGEVFAAEGADVTLRGPGGFIRIDASGVTISGALVLINEGGSPGSAADARPRLPHAPKEADVTESDGPAPPTQVDPTVTIARVMRGNPHVESSADPGDGMIDSVPPTRSYAVQVTVTPQLEPGRFIDVVIVGGSAANGTATVTPARISATTVVTVTGGAQTGPGNAGNLKIQASLEGTMKAESAGFTVCSHPLNLRNTLRADVDGALVGAIVNVAWDSDSGTFTDLDRAWFSEKVVYGRQDVPPFQGGASLNSGYLAASVAVAVDQHRAARPAAGPSGVREADQLFIFKCDRCGVVDKVQPHSGMHIIHRVFLTGTQWKHKFWKSGAKTTIGAWTSEAGTCNVVTPDHLLP